VNDPMNDKIQAFLLRSLEDKRGQIIAQQAEAALQVEWIDERIEEREYDEQERLRVDRVVRRRIFRGEALERYSTLVAKLRGKEGGGEERISEVRSQLDLDLRTVAVPEKVRGNVPAALRHYSDLVPAEDWPVILCMARNAGKTAGLKERLLSFGFSVLQDTLLERLGVLKFSCPPEVSFVREIAGLAETSAVAAPWTPITMPKPMAVSTNMVESRDILGVTPEMRANFGHDVTLAVLDTGLDRKHPAFARVAAEDYCDFTATGLDDENGHGSHVASIAAGDDPTQRSMYGGIAPRCRLISGKVLTPGKAGNLETILSGMAWAVFDRRADILSLSLGDEGTLPNGRSIWTQACDEAFRNGTVVCVAAGNPMPSYPESVGVPADSVTAVTVGALDKQRYLAPFSAMGSTDQRSPLFGKPNCVSPGVDIVAARSCTADFGPSETIDSYHVRLSGTSMATPAVAGCLALLKSKAKSLGWQPSPDELIKLFYSACKPITDPNGEEYSKELQIGHGLVCMADAFLAAERQAPPYQGRAVDAGLQPPKRAGLDFPAVAAGSGASAPAAASGTGPFQPDVCYRCGKQYLSKVGAFSPAWTCPECDAPICRICWHLGNRGCEKHKQSNLAGSSAPAAALAPAPERPAASAHAAAPATTTAAAKGATAMSTSDASSEQAFKTMAPHWGETFLNRVDLKVRHAAHVSNPWSGDAFAVDPKVQAQSFRRKFGDVTQYPLSAGLLIKERFTLAAIRLDPAALQSEADLLQRISGQDGLDFQEGSYYCVGIFSPAGWPDEWKAHAEARGNVLFYLVEKGEGTCWTVFGPKGPLRELFDPETRTEKKARAEKALASHPRLVIPGDQVPLDAFLQEQKIDRESVDAAIGNSAGRYQTFEHKGKTYIQITTR
jgi:subtilisin family serine protease